MERGGKLRTSIGLFAAVLIAVVAATSAAFHQEHVTVHGSPLSSASGEVGDQAFMPWDSFYSVSRNVSGRWFVVGAGGTLLSSANQGLTWSRRTFGQVYPFGGPDLYSVRFAKDGIHGWISGENGLILYTDNGGRSWVIQHSGAPDDLYRITPIDARRAVAVGARGALLYTEDGGKSWERKKQQTDFTFFDVTFSDPFNGWVVGEFETVLHTSDGGRTWEVQKGAKRSSFESPAFFSVCFRDNTQGWITGQGGGIFHTADSGRTWSLIVSSGKSDMYACTFSNERLLAAGDDGVLRIVTVDAGAERVSEIQPSHALLTDLSVAGGEGFAVGFGGAILRTEDNGAHWREVVRN